MDAPPAALRTRFPRREWRPISDGRSGAGVWRLRDPHDPHDPHALDDLVAKAGVGFDAVAEAARLRWLRARGLPVPEVVDSGAAGDVRWLVTTAVPGRPASAGWPVEQHGAVVDALADVARALHALPVDDCPFDRGLAVTVDAARHAVRAGLVDLDDLDDERAGWTADRLLAELEATRPADEDPVVCHGDLTPANVLVDPGALVVTGLVDVGGLGRADRHRDLALITRELTDDAFGPGAVARFLRRYGGPAPDPDRLAFYRLLDEFS